MTEGGDVRLNRIVEVDEAYVEGMPQGGGCKSRRGTKKAPDIGAVVRGERVVAQLMKNLSGQNIKYFFWIILIKNLFNMP